MRLMVILLISSMIVSCTNNDTRHNQAADLNTDTNIDQTTINPVSYIDSSFITYYEQSDLNTSFDSACYDWKVISERITILPDSLGGRSITGTAVMKFFIDAGKINHFMLYYLDLKKKGEQLHFDKSDVEPYNKYFLMYKDSITINKLFEKDECLVQEEGVILFINRK